jgi:hypothetical protein
VGQALEMVMKVCVGGQTFEVDSNVGRDKDQETTWTKGALWDIQIVGVQAFKTDKRQRSLAIFSFL